MRIFDHAVHQALFPLITWLVSEPPSGRELAVLGVHGTVNKSACMAGEGVGGVVCSSKAVRRHALSIWPCVCCSSCNKMTCPKVGLGRGTQEEDGQNSEGANGGGPFGAEGGNWKKMPLAFLGSSHKINHSFRIPISWSSCWSTQRSSAYPTVGRYPTIKDVEVPGLQTFGCPLTGSTPWYLWILLSRFSKPTNIRYILSETILNHFNFLCPWALPIRPESEADECGLWSSVLLPPHLYYRKLH